MPSLLPARASASPSLEEARVRFESGAFEHVEQLTRLLGIVRRQLDGWGWRRRIRRTPQALGRLAAEWAHAQECLEQVRRRADAEAWPRESGARRALERCQRVSGEVTSLARKRSERNAATDRGLPAALTHLLEHAAPGRARQPGAKRAELTFPLYPAAARAALLCAGFPLVFSLTFELFHLASPALFAVRLALTALFLASLSLRVTVRVNSAQKTVARVVRVWGMEVGREARVTERSTVVVVRSPRTSRREYAVKVTHLREPGRTRALRLVRAPTLRRARQLGAHVAGELGLTLDEER